MSSPYRQRKPRGKYVSRACEQCRKRKLKCSGHDPCHRCLRQREACVFTDARRHSTSSRNGTTDPVGGMTPFAPLNGTKPLTVEERLERLEARFNAFASRARESLRSSIEPEQNHVNDFQGETAFQAPIDAFNANIEPMRARLGLPTQDNASSTQSSSKTHEGHAASPTYLTYGTSVRVGSRNLPFPAPAEYANYIAFFFEDINPCHSCVNHADFQRRRTKLLNKRAVERDEICFLALNYIIFACADILRSTNATSGASDLPGWQWFLVADGLVGKRKVSGIGDISLVQFLVYEAFYLVHADRPNAAYNVIGLACRLCFQFGLHQQRLWGQDCDGFTTHIRQRLCWTVYFTDRRIALSCGRPYGMRDSDVRLDHPTWLNDLDVKPLTTLPSPDPYHSSVMYLCCMIAFARFAGEVWDQVFAAGTAEYSPEQIIVLDARIRHWMETVLPSMQLHPVESETTKRHLRQHCLVVTRFNHLRLLLRRRAMVSLTFDSATGKLCGQLAMNNIDQIARHRDEICEPSSFRFHMAVSLGGAILVLATLLCRDLASIGLQSQHEAYACRFQDAVRMLSELSIFLNAAKRICDDLSSIVQVVDSILNTRVPSSHEDYPSMIPSDLDTLFPYGAVDFAQQHELDAPSNVSQAGSGLMDYDAFASVDSWDHDFLRSGSGYGVPWI